MSTDGCKSLQDIRERTEMLVRVGSFQARQHALSARGVVDMGREFVRARRREFDARMNERRRMMEKRRRSGARFIVYAAA